MDATLFNDLPDQKAPTRREAGGKAIERCPKCKGSGRTRYSAYGGGYHAERCGEPCRRCEGGGWIPAASSA